LAARNAARSEICFSFIEVDPEHVVAASGECRCGGEAFGWGLAAPIEALFGACLEMGELPWGLV
jgi:hypothetical protein